MVIIILFLFNKVICPPIIDNIGYASQGTPPNSPAAASIFSKVMGAAAASKQNQGSGNSLGIAAVLLHGAQGKFRARKKILNHLNQDFIVFHYFAY